MVRAIFNERVIAESDKTVLLEGNHYFPRESLFEDFFRVSDVSTSCPWKGLASYLDVVVEGKVADYAAWFYSEPKAEAEQIRGLVAFWRGVHVEE